ncbi:hypothetical protein P9J64_02465 [Deltaproteobacteria bacterium IMCC39524]|nr:hypothetical protein [Deltaproteobacteria bacterium IMCC39524]
MKNSFFILLLITILFASSVDTAFAANIDLPGQMAMVGVWHGEEVSAKHGESWLALLETSSGFELQEVTLSVEIVVDDVIDIPPSKTGKKVSVPEGFEPLVLLRDLSQLRPGPVLTIASHDESLNITPPKKFLLNGSSYLLEFKCATEFLGQEFADCPLQLSEGNKIQALQNYPIYHPSTSKATIASDVSPRVLWAGDLDRDGRIDLLLDLTTHYNVSTPTLLLSSMAGKGALVRPAAAFRTTGC